MKLKTHSKRLDTGHEGGHALLVFVIILLTSIGSYSFYNKGTKKADIQVVARSLQQISAGDVFAHKIIGRMMAALKDAPHSACYDGTELSKVLEGYATGALRDFTPVLDPNLANALGKSMSEDSHQIFLIFADDHKVDGSADKNNGLDLLKSLFEGNEENIRYVDLPNLNDLTLNEGMNTAEYLNDEKTENCLSSTRDRRHIISYYIRVTPISVKPEAYSKRILLEVGGVARMPHGASQVTSFKKAITFDMSYSSLENVGFVFNNAQQSSAPLITLSTGTELEFKTPVFLHDAAGNISSLGKIMSKSQGAGWDGSNLLFQKKLYTNRTSLDISEAESLGAFVASFTQGIALKTFYDLPFADYLPPTFALKYQKDLKQGDEHPPLPTNGQIFENCQSDTPVDEAPEVINTGSSFVITVDDFSSCEREYPFVISTSGSVTIDFNAATNASEDEVFFCGIIQANNLTIKAPGADIAHVVFGTFVVSHLTIDGADDARVIFQNVKDPFINSHTNTFISNLYNNHFYRLFSYEFHGETMHNKPDLLKDPVKEVYTCSKSPGKQAYQPQGTQQFGMLLSQIDKKRTTHEDSLIIFR